MKIHTTSDRHLYINDHLIDLNQVIGWFNSKTWGGHNPHQNIIRLTKLVEEIHNGHSELSDRAVREHLVYNLIYLNLYGYYLDDIVFKGSPVPIYKEKRSNRKYLGNFFTKRDQKELEENQKYERVDL